MGYYTPCVKTRLSCSLAGGGLPLDVLLTSKRRGLEQFS